MQKRTPRQLRDRGTRSLRGIGVRPGGARGQGTRQLGPDGMGRVRCLRRRQRVLARRVREGRVPANRRLGRVVLRHVVRPARDGRETEHLPPVAPPAHDAEDRQCD